MSVVAIVQGHATDVLARPLTHAEAALITGYLSLSGIPVLVTVDQRGVAQLWPERYLSPEQEVAVLRCIAAVTDSRIDWHGRRQA